MNEPGSIATFEELYRRHARDVYRFALYLTGDTAQAEDIASGTFVRVWAASDRLRVTTVKAYLFTIARNLHLHGLRGRSRRVSLPADPPVPRPGPQLEAEGRERLGLVLRALGRLTPTDRAALLMRAQDGMSYEEIAAALGLSLSAVEVRIHRARLRLSEEEEGR